MPTIYKICTRSQWRSAEHDGRYRGSALDRRDGFIHFSTAAQAGRNRRQTFRRTGRSDAGRGRCRGAWTSLKWERSRGGDLFPHLYAALPLAAVRWARPLDDEVGGPALVSGARSVIGFLDRLARPFLRALDPEDAHGMAIKMLKFAPLPPAPRDDSRLASACLRPQFSESGRHCGRLRQACRSAGCAAAPRLRLRRSRHHHADAAARQSAAAAVPP